MNLDNHPLKTVCNLSKRIAAQKEKLAEIMERPVKTDKQIEAKLRRIDNTKARIQKATDKLNDIIYKYNIRQE